MRLNNTCRYLPLILFFKNLMRSVQSCVSNLVDNCITSLLAVKFFTTFKCGAFESFDHDIEDAFAVAIIQQIGHILSCKICFEFFTFIF